MKKSTFRLIALLVIWLGIFNGKAFGYDSVTSFGDSLSDNGNVGRYTDGQLWVELLAEHFSVPLIDHAYVGATTSYDNPAISSLITGLLWQVETFSPFLTSNSLITVWAGANDFLQGRSFSDAAFNIGTALQELYAAGGRNFLIPNLPDIGKTPYFLFVDPSDSASASAWTVAFNTSLEGVLQGFENSNTGTHLFSVDIFSIFNQFTIGSTEWGKLFWTDGFHPSSTGHELIYQAAAAAVPESETLTLFAAGLMGIAGIMYRRGIKQD